MLALLAAACLEKDRYTLSPSGCVGGGLVLFDFENMLGIPDFTGQSEEDPESPVLGEVTLGKPPVDSGLVSSFAGLFRPWQRSCKSQASYRKIV